MNQSDFLIEQIGDKLICLKGIGKMFYQDGFPISIAISNFKSKGIDVSLFHIADECLKHGWSSETTFKKLREDVVDGNFETNLEQLKLFCYSNYETHRVMIFESLFGGMFVTDVTQFITNKLINP
jgi:hypothetical protein